jgi:hypothetical protein
MKNSTDISKLSNEEIKAEAAKIVAAKNVQRERMKSRGKEKRAFIKSLLAVAATKGLLPDSPVVPVAATKTKQ